MLGIFPTSRSRPSLPDGHASPLLDCNVDIIVREQVVDAFLKSTTSCVRNVSFLTNEDI